MEDSNASIRSAISFIRFTTCLFCSSKRFSTCVRSDSTQSPSCCGAADSLVLLLIVAEGRASVVVGTSHRTLTKIAKIPLGLPSPGSAPFFLLSTTSHAAGVLYERARRREKEAISPSCDDSIPVPVPGSYPYHHVPPRQTGSSPPYAHDELERRCLPRPESQAYQDHVSYASRVKCAPR